MYFNYLFDCKNIIEKDDVSRIRSLIHENACYSKVLVIVPDTLDGFGSQYFIKKMLDYYYINDNNIDLRIVDRLDYLKDELNLDRYNFNFEKYNLVFLLNCDYTTNFVNDKNNNDILRKTIRIVNYSNQSNHVFDDYYVNITNEDSNIKIATTAICYMLSKFINSVFDKFDEFIVKTIDGSVDQLNDTELERKRDDKLSKLYHMTSPYTYSDELSIIYEVMGRDLFGLLLENSPDESSFKNNISKTYLSIRSKDYEYDNNVFYRSMQITKLNNGLTIAIGFGDIRKYRLYNTDRILYSYNDIDRFKNIDLCVIIDTSKAKGIIVGKSPYICTPYLATVLNGINLNDCVVEYPLNTLDTKLSYNSIDFLEPFQTLDINNIKRLEI